MTRQLNQCIINNKKSLMMFYFELFDHVDLYCLAMYENSSVYELVFFVFAVLSLVNNCLQAIPKDIEVNVRDCTPATRKTVGIYISRDLHKAF